MRCGFDAIVLRVVDTASQRGNTPQDRVPEVLPRRCAARGFVAAGRPSSDLGDQQSGNNEAFANFLENQITVHFPMFKTNSVRAAGGGASVDPRHMAPMARAGPLPP